MGIFGRLALGQLFKAELTAEDGISKIFWHDFFRLSQRVEIEPDIIKLGPNVPPYQHS